MGPGNCQAQQAATIVSLVSSTKRLSKGGRAGRKLLCGGVAQKPICPTPPSPSLVAVPGGGFGLGLLYLPCRGGGGDRIEKQTNANQR